MEPVKEKLTVLPFEKNSLLIAEVKKFPCLYDNTQPNYYILAERNRAWLQVADNCGEPPNQCHLRWKSLRKRYAKEKRRFTDILQGKRRPWALFPKMSFLISSSTSGGFAPKRRIKHNKKPIPKSKNDVKPDSEDDMLILGENDEILHTCKSTELSEEDEYIYDTLDDPDSAFVDIMKGKPPPKVKPIANKPTAIRSSGPMKMPAPVSSRIGGSGRIRKVTSKMQNSFIAKKLKQAQQVIHQSTVSCKSPSLPDKSEKAMPVNKQQTSRTNANDGKTVLCQDKTRHIAKVNPNVVRVEKFNQHENRNPSATTNDLSSGTPPKQMRHESTSTEENRPFKIVKLKGRNPLIFSPDQLPEIQSFLKSEAAFPSPEKSNSASPMIKVKSVDNLNSQNLTTNFQNLTANSQNQTPNSQNLSPTSQNLTANSPNLTGNSVGSVNNQSTSPSSDQRENNLDIIHSVGLMRKKVADKLAKPPPLQRAGSHHHASYSRAYSWNRPDAKQAKKQKQTEKLQQQPDSQTNDFEIEEAWNDIKEENIDDQYWNNNPQVQDTYLPHEPMVLLNSPDSLNRSNSLNRINEAQLELITYQRKLLEEQHRKTLEFMKKEHDLKMSLLKAEIDLKRKQLNIML